jgi:NADPH:quinone reductase-like Zn-dependent oxidoreductase
MTRKYKILGVIAVVLIAATVATVLFASHNDPCGQAPALPANAERMKAIVVRCYGPPEILKLEEIEKPKPEPDQVLVKVHAASINPLEWHEMRGTPYQMRRERGWGAPKETRLGVDYAGTVEAVGANVTTFKPGDEVFGARSGALAEYVAATESRAILPKPANVSFEQASTVAIAGITALQALRDWGKIKAGQKVLINGASGGVGTFAVQIAKAYGAEVTGVCSTRNVGLVRSIGADHVIDYKKENFTEGQERYDLIVDIVSSQSLRALTRVMQPGGIVVVVGNAESGKWLGHVVDARKTELWDRFVSQQFFRMRTDVNKEDLNFLRDLMETGKLTPVIDRSYPFAEVPAAMAYLETGRARGKVVIDVQ